MGAESAENAELTAETLLVLADAFGEDLPRRVHLLAKAEPFLEDAVLSKLRAAVTRLDVLCKQERAPPPEPPASTLSATVEGVELAQSALEDFVSSYFMFHGLSATCPDHTLRYVPFLTLVEAHIYGLDLANEDHLQPEEGSSSLEASLLLSADPFRPLKEVLQARGWLSPQLDAELSEGSRFWALERKLCSAMAAGDELQRGDVEEALRLKSFDYRVMNLLLYAMRGEEPNKEHLQFLAASEKLVELGDDLTDYTEDVQRNSFNVYRCFIALYGPERGRENLSAWIKVLESEYAEALQKLSPELASEWKRRCETVQRHGAGSERGPGGGEWILPEPIGEDFTELCSY